MLATHGYATLALQYFDAPGLPESLERIPLGYFDTAIRWLTSRPTVHDTGIGLLGISRGVEAALLTATGYDGPVAVIGYSGGGVVRHGVAGVPRQDTSTSPPGLATALRLRTRTLFERRSTQSKITVDTTVMPHRS
ncbi:hypothetical protein BG842_03765 [Haladaptatus sp. W1]|uniref:acyl-CoA thioester hydrolase/BAAT C-terminal domain-containing protein n=1 Tax=Haladaptatus sp. W1 TaxID=1897478 RepID=UPI000849D7BC|nr:acyl-CoA thioester hydrolase/BAAT C-terminal domain-containing protein [Haladaptatus sp. W1]ODR80642.1 hypothetical protein BG842_03765 [Haladaptatus sp. W1]